MADDLTEIDRRSALEEARNSKLQMPNAQSSHPGDLHVPKNTTTSNLQGSTDETESNNHSERLDAARRGSIRENLKNIRDLGSIATPMGAVSLVKQIDLIADMPYVAAMGAALLKDLLDFVAAETIVLSALFSMLCTIFIFMMLLLVGANGKKKGASKLLSKIGVLGVGGIADSIPGIDFFPIESITVAVLYVMELIERKNALKR
jgi:hypothetical protein